MSVDSFDQSSACESYEGDADDDSFATTCSNQKSTVPDFSPSSTRTLSSRSIYRTPRSSRRTRSTISSLEYSIESDTDLSESAHSFGTSFIVPTTHSIGRFGRKDMSREINMEGNKFEFHSDTKTDLSEKNLVILNANSDSADFEIDFNHKAVTSEHTNASFKKDATLSPSLQSRSSSHHTKETVISSDSMSSTIKSIDSPPTLKKFMSSEETTFRPLPRRDENEEILGPDLTSVPPLPSFVVHTCDTSPSPQSSFSGSSPGLSDTSFSTALRDPLESCDADLSGSKNKSIEAAKSRRVQAIKSRLRSIEHNYRRGSSLSSLGTSGRNLSTRDIKDGADNSSHSQASNIAIRIAREIMIVSFASFVIYLCYLSHRDAKMNEMQLHMTQMRMIEQTMESARDAKLQTLQQHLERMDSFMHSLASDQGNMQQQIESTSAILGSLESPEAKTGDASVALEVAEPVPVPAPNDASAALEVAEPVPVPSPLLQPEEQYANFAPTLIMHQEQKKRVVVEAAPMKKKLNIPMQDFFIVQSLLD